MAALVAQYVGVIARGTNARPDDTVMMVERGCRRNGADRRSLDFLDVNVIHHAV
jgi:hypothetical protein